MDRNLALECIRVTEAAALAAARQMGRGDEMEVDLAAATALEAAFGSIDVDGRVVIGEGYEEDRVPLYHGETIGTGRGPKIQIAVDAVEGPAACAAGGPNALSVVAISDDAESGMPPCPPVYMEKIAVGPAAKNAVDVRAAPRENIERVAEALGLYVRDVTVVLLDRPRHAGIVNEVREVGARLKLIPDGDLSAALATLREGSGIDLLLGVGRAPQGVLAAAAMRCAGGGFQGRFVSSSPEDRAALDEAGITDLEKVYTQDDLARGDVMFAATGVTSGDFLPGVRFTREGAVTCSCVLRSRSGTIRTITAEHHFDREPTY